MTFEVGVLLALTAACVVLFAAEWVSPDVTGLMLVLALIFTGLLTPAVAFQGFGSDVVITMLGLLILTAALLRTGVVDLVGGKILDLTGTSPTRLLVVVMVACAAMSAFMSNTASTAFFVPIVMGLARRAKMSPKQLLLPIAFASILTSSVTLMSTSTNIVVSGLMTRGGLEPMGMFELAPVGIPIAVIGLLYMVVVSRLGWRRSAAPTASVALFRAYLSEVRVRPGSRLAGQTLAQATSGRDAHFSVVHLVRGQDEYLSPDAGTVIRPDDLLLIEAGPEDVLTLAATAGVELGADIGPAEPTSADDETGIVEVILPWNSPLLGRRLGAVGLGERYGLHVLGISRHGKVRQRPLASLRLRVGNILLIQGRRTMIATLQDEGALQIIQAHDARQPRRRRALVAIAVFVGVLALVSFKVLPFSVAVILGSVAMFLTRCITPEEAYHELEWKVLILIGSMLAMGAAMEQTGAARYLASMIVHSLGDLGPMWLLAGFFALTVLLTQPMSNQAAAVVVMPVALQTAQQLGLNPRTFAMMIAVAASCSYLTPLEPSCLMVYGPGGYKFSDFLKIGSVLTLIIAAIALALVPFVWPLR